MNDDEPAVAEYNAEMLRMAGMKYMYWKTSLFTARAECATDRSGVDGLPHAGVQRRGTDKTDSPNTATYWLPIAYISPARPTSMRSWER